MGIVRCLAAIRMGNVLAPKADTSLGGKAVHLAILRNLDQWKEARSKRGSHGHS
uniref:Uncharacterized protein n=1 Tax=Candidatus Kentrum sp. TC TaxID=2126339 RepID=A0A450YD11_9GAMM|nr:MAG: hypothetical protein BECKTC1821D_GA0114238_100624 [Candidatus Kentron sp. TC]